MFEVDFHNHIVKYKGKTFQISSDNKRIQIGIKWVKIPQPYILGRNKKYRVDIQLGIEPDGKRIRKAFFYPDYKTALNGSIKWVLKRELGEIQPEKPIEIKPEPLKVSKRPFKITEKIKKENEKINELNNFRRRIKKHGRKWSIIVKEKGKTKRYSFDTYEEAEEFALELVEKKSKKKKELTLLEGIKLYAENLQIRNKNNYGLLHKYLYSFKHFIEKWGENFPWKKITEMMVENYITERLKEKNPQTGKNITEKTIKNELKFLRACWNFLLRNGYITGVNYADIVLKKRKFKENERKRALSYEETLRFLKELTEMKNDRYSKQKKGILFILFFTGARFEETLRLRKEHIRILNINDEKYGMIHFTSDITKNGKERKIDIPYELALFLLSISPNSKLLFPDYQTEYKKRKFKEWLYKDFFKKCNIENFYVHDFRHNWATMAENLGISIRIIRELGGWNSLITTSRYINPVSENKKNPMNNFVANLIMEIKTKKELSGSKPEKEEGGKK